MIAISSYRPREQSETIFALQVAAHLTWEKVFTRIVYVGEPVGGLLSPRTVFLPGEDKPTILDLCRVASSMTEGWAALINADIQIEEKAKHLERVLAMHKIDCAFSFRIPVGRTQREDLGLDFFCARQEVWLHAVREIPREFQIGKQLWDTWMASFFMKHYRCADVSASRLIFHPDHGERGDQAMEIERDDYLKHMKWRTTTVRF